MADELTLKWGTLKGWNIESSEFREALDAYAAVGEHSAGAMTQHDTPEQKEKLCAVIDAVSKTGGTIINDWEGTTMTAAEAKDYVMNYGRRF